MIGKRVKSRRFSRVSIRLIFFFFLLLFWDTTGKKGIWMTKCRKKVRRREKKRREEKLPSFERIGNFGTDRAGVINFVINCINQRCV